MRPLLAKDLTAFMQRFDNFRDGEFRSIEVISPVIIKVSFAGQDANRAHDWITVNFEFSNITDAALLDNSDCSLVDMSDGIDLSFTNQSFSMKSKNSSFFITASSLKYEESNF